MPVRKTREQFIEQARLIHLDKYDYSAVRYTNSYTKVQIYCNRHAKYFWQRPMNHLEGQGCALCRHEFVGQKIKSSKEEFIKKARKVHKNRNYDYSSVIYEDSESKVEIGCDVEGHGVFMQSPHSHLKGAGCPICAESRKGWGGSKVYSTNEPSHLYMIEIETDEMKWIKVGLSKQPKVRIRVLKNNVPDCVDITVLGLWKGPAKTLYKRGEIPTLYYSKIPRLEVEDWSWAGYTECFDISYKNQLEEFLTTTLTPLQGVERIL